jgi:hypothetical protein
MIQAIWIITDTGQCIFSHKYIKMDIEDQLISGLLTAFDAFSNESGIGGVQNIGGEDSQFVYGTAGKLLVAALADKIDNSKLIEDLLNKISVKFSEKYARHLQDQAYIDMNAFEGFEKEINEILFPKIFKRGVGSTIFATLITAVFTVGVLFMMANFIGSTNSTFLIFLACIPGLLIGSLVAGTRKFALISSSIGITPIVGFSVYQIAISLPIDQSILIIVLMVEQFYTIAILSAILGGSIIERRRLFPLMKENLKEEQEEDIYSAPVPQPNLSAPSPRQQTDHYEADNNRQSDAFYSESSSLIDDNQ